MKRVEFRTGVHRGKLAAYNIRKPACADVIIFHYVLYVFFYRIAGIILIIHLTGHHR